MVYEIMLIWVPNSRYIYLSQWGLGFMLFPEICTRVESMGENPGVYPISSKLRGVENSEILLMVQKSSEKTHRLDAKNPGK